MKAFLLAALLLAFDGERDNNQDNVRPIPPPGVAVPEADKAELETGLKALGEEIAALRPKVNPDLRADVEIYHKAVRYALHHNEFQSLETVKQAS